MADVIYVPKSDILDLITGEYEAGGFTDYSNYSNLWDEIDDMPAADVQPVAHAEWVCLEPEIGLYYSCSNCRYKTLQGMHKFCPNCGARMKGAINND